MKSDYKWELKLYPDSSDYDYNLVLITAQDYFDEWAFILHDQDTSEDGKPIKPHIHFYGALSSGPRTLESIAHMCCVPTSAIQYVKSWKGAIRYLTHIDFPTKHQYEIESISSNFSLDPFFNRKKDDDDEKALLIIKEIDNYRNKHDNNPTIEYMARWSISNKCWSAYRRGFAVWSQILK